MCPISPHSGCIFGTHSVISPHPCNPILHDRLLFVLNDVSMHACMHDVGAMHDEVTMKCTYDTKTKFSYTGTNDL